MRSTLALVLLAACDIGTPGNPDLPIDAPPPIDAYVCDPSVTPGTGGPVNEPNHNVGQACLQCHDDNLSDGAPTFSIGGTLYDGPSGNNPVAGATIIVEDASGAVVKLSTAANGNFYAGGALTLPVHVKATQCPKTRTMQQQSVGDCNQGGCHGPGDTQGRVFLQVNLP
jgi:hypothetical protein